MLEGDTDITTALDHGETLILADDPGAVAFHARLADRYLDDARVAFAHAGAMDSAGDEHGALREYRRALDIGLPDDLRQRLYVQMGSTLRNVGDVKGAVTLLEEGVAAFPDDLAMACFLALARHTAGQPGGAIAEVIRAILRADELGVIHLPRYQRSLRAYADAVAAEDDRTT
ncbi:MAG TPA: tetratricopeptide repeat protein [Thermomicrobiales bacterium]|jgi:tetratricopeptide (TPR) repeat protein|nr:tetratricopeptide repeat protein [Thermomicrobiales bacterium]